MPTKHKLIDYAVMGIVFTFGLAFLLGLLYIVKITAPLSLPFVGFALWWCYYFFECGINGGTTHSVFKYAADDFKNNFGSKESQHAHRLSLSNGNEEWAAMFPGKVHCIGTHVVLPLLPLILWLVL